MSATEKAGHTFLASLGKTRLRPGGVEATEWLFSQSQLTPGSQVLEVACNMATTAIELVQRVEARWAPAHPRYYVHHPKTGRGRSGPACRCGEIKR